MFIIYVLNRYFSYVLKSEEKLESFTAYLG